ncbi:MAG: type II secretion system protein [Sulfurimonadaceae bacterium]
MKKQAFTMIELIFVIVVLGILAAVAIPKFAATRVDAQIAKGRAEVASIRSGIVSERQSRLIKGCTGYIPNGTGTYVCNGQTYPQMNNGGLFGGILMYPLPNIANEDGKWSSANTGIGTYVFRAGGANNTFDYNSTNGRFTCTAGTYCDKLVN